MTITRRHEPFAVVIPVETYARLAGTEASALNTPSAEFAVLLERMQESEMAAAMRQGRRSMARIDRIEAVMVDLRPKVKRVDAI